MQLPFKNNQPRTISLALQGGGAHGAFTWGVLDALLEDGTTELDGISGTSAGAMNAVVLAHGLTQGGRDGAREALQAFWQAIADSTPFDAGLNGDASGGGLSPGVRMMLFWARQFSPQQLNPFDINPLRTIVTEQIDFERLREACPVKLFVAATHANNGRLRLFRNDEMSAEALLASACLPSIHHAVEVDGEHYWDGAYAANPAVFPLFYDCDAADILLVLLSPPVLGETPKSAEDVRNRSLDLAFNAAFLREMGAYARAREFAKRTPIALGKLDRRLRRARFHSIEADSLVSGRDAASRLTTSRAFLEMMRDAGRNEAAEWLDAHRAALGRRSSIDICARFA